MTDISLHFPGQAEQWMGTLLRDMFSIMGKAELKYQTLPFKSLFDLG